MKKIKNIAIISFESKKTDLIEWSYFNKDILIPHQIFTSGFAGNILEGTLNKKINAPSADSLSGYRQLCNLISDGKIDAVIIFGEAAEIFESKDVKAVFETAIQHNIIVAANKTTADFILHSSLLQSEYKIHSKEKKQTDNKEILSSSVSYPLAKAS